MLPIRDANPALMTPFVTIAIVATCALVFFGVQPRSAESGEEFFYEAASIPCEITSGEALNSAEIRGAECGRGEGSPVFPDKNIWFSLLSSIFFHGDIAHLLGNLWVLWIFGNNVEDAYGRIGYVALYVLTGLAASAGHIALNPGSTVPVVGASGAIAGIMGAYLVLFPSARVVSIIPPLFFWPFVIPAALFLFVWLVAQFALAGAATNIAWEAHVVGFLAGLGVTWFNRNNLRTRISTHTYREWSRRH